MEIEDGRVMEFIESEKARLLKEYNCKTIEEVLRHLEAKLKEKS